MNVQKVTKVLFTGEHKYTVGLLFIFGNLAGFFLNMRKLNITDGIAMIILLILSLVARLVV